MSKSQLWLIFIATGMACWLQHVFLLHRMRRWFLDKIFVSEGLLPVISGVVFAIVCTIYETGMLPMSTYERFATSCIPLFLSFLLAAPSYSRGCGLSFWRSSWEDRNFAMGIMAMMGAASVAIGPAPRVWSISGGSFELALGAGLLLLFPLSRFRQEQRKVIQPDPLPLFVDMERISGFHDKDVLCKVSLPVRAGRTASLLQRTAHLQSAWFWGTSGRMILPIEILQNVEASAIIAATARKRSCYVHGFRLWFGMTGCSDVARFLAELAKFDSYIFHFPTPQDALRWYTKVGAIRELISKTTGESSPRAQIERANRLLQEDAELNIRYWRSEEESLLECATQCG